MSELSGSYWGAGGFSGAAAALINEVSKFFKENKAAYGNYDMVVGYQKNGAFLYVNDSLDITKSVISDLNAKVK